MNTLTLSAWYLLQFILIFIIFCGIGSLLLPSFKPVDRAESAWNWVLRYGMGLAASIFIVIFLGLFGMINRWALLSVFVILSGMGIFRYFKSGRGAFVMTKKWELKRGEIILFGIGVTIYFALNINVLIGGMCPNMGQDTLWYHLSVPVQWTLTGKAAAFHFVMPSNYALGMEAIYSALLLFSNEILCSMIYCQIVIVLLAGMAVASYRFAGWAGALIVMGCIAPFTTTLAPVPPANDSAAVLLLFIGFVRLAFHIKNARSAIHDDILTGFIFGSAIAVKLTSIIFCAPIILFWLVFAFNHARARRFLIALVLLMTTMLIAYAPWAARGFQYCGNPVFPLAKSVFPVKPEYQGMAEASGRLNSSYPLTLNGIQKAITDLPDKINYLLTGSDVMFWLMLMAAMALIFNGQKHARFMGWSLIGFYGGFLIMKGHNEVGRYFSIGYPVSAPAIGIAFALLISRMKYRFRILLMIVLIASATGIYSRKQITQANWTTMQWKFRPILTQRAIDQYAQHAEFGQNYLFYSKLRSTIEPDACVFLADETHPYYLKRKCIWGDEVTIGAFQKSWSNKTPEQMREYLEKQNARYVVCLKNNFSLFHSMEQKKMLRRISFESVYAKDLGFWSVENIKQ